MSLFPFSGNLFWWQFRNKTQFGKSSKKNWLNLLGKLRTAQINFHLNRMSSDTKEIIWWRHPQVSIVVLLDRSSHWCSVNKGVLKNFENFTGKHLCWGLFFLWNLRNLKKKTIPKNIGEELLLTWWLINQGWWELRA